jgi:predicted HTH domain antitoxin
MSLVRRYDRGEISSSAAAKLLGVPRVAFLDTLGQHGVPCIDVSRLEADFANA